MRRGVTLIMTIFLLVFLSIATVLMLSLSALTTKLTSDSYLYEQAQLLAKSSAEYTMLAISGHDRNTTALANMDCINSINAQYPDNVNPLFDINISIRYVGFGSSAANNCNSYIDTIFTPETNGTILLDVMVRSNDNLQLNEPIVYHKRTLQKP